ncbi:hypothetical protein [Limosilactobacillus difficilis]|uniref:hypothetical protein n=1 Tax=Limosilactobacillus difficilis TaxID=2991838 RepID=UPI0024BB14CA|nr:hypothetical protein [Limosilactobacillus difficilis]
MVSRRDTRRILRPDHNQGMNVHQVLPWLTLLFLASWIFCIFGTGLPWVNVLFQCLADLSEWLFIICLAYALWTFRQWIVYFSSTSPFRCLISPQMNLFLYDRNIIQSDTFSQNYCRVSKVKLDKSSFSMPILPGTLKTITDDSFTSELGAYMNQAGCNVKLLPPKIKNGRATFEIRPNLHHDRLHYDH